MKKTIYFILLAIVVVVTTIFTMQNTNRVDVRFFNWDLQMPLAYIVFLSIFTGMVLLGLWFLIKAFKYKAEIRRLKKQCKKYEKQLPDINN